MVSIAVSPNVRVCILLTFTVHAVMVLYRYVVFLLAGVALFSRHPVRTAALSRARVTATSSAAALCREAGVNMTATNATAAFTAPITCSKSFLPSWKCSHWPYSSCV